MGECKASYDKFDHFLNLAYNKNIECKKTLNLNACKGVCDQEQYCSKNNKLMSPLLGPVKLGILN